MSQILIGQPWRIQPWNTLQKAEFLGPWTCEDMFVTGEDGGGGTFSELATKNRAFLFDAKTGRTLRADIDENGALGLWRSENDDHDVLSSWYGCADIQLTKNKAVAASENGIGVAAIDPDSGEVGTFVVSPYPGDELFINNVGANNNEASMLTRDTLWYFGGDDGDYGSGWCGIDGNGNVVSGWHASLQHGENSQFQLSGTPRGPAAATFMAVGKDGQRRIYRINGYSAAWTILDPDEDEDREAGFHLRFRARGRAHGGGYQEFRGGWAYFDRLYDSRPVTWAEVVGKEPPDYEPNGYTGESLRSVATARRVYLFTRELILSAPIRDDGSLGAFVRQQIPVEWDVNDRPNYKADHVFITSSRIYVVSPGTGKQWWAPFMGGANNYLDTTTEDYRPAYGAFRLTPTIAGSARKGGGSAFAGEYRIWFETRGRATSHSPATHVLRGRFDLTPECRGVMAARPNVLRGEWTHPMFECRGKASRQSHHVMRGRYDLPMFQVRGTCSQEAGDWVLRFRRPEVL